MTDEKPLFWIGRRRDDLKECPDEVMREIGYALDFSQRGGKHPNAKPLKGFGGASVLEIVEDNDGDTYRAVYTVKFPLAVYVLHVFQKKSKKGMATPKRDLDLIDERLKRAESHYQDWVGQARRTLP
ncbi:MAG: type II toxin-antitoxin system RelE/ParE family toxin [Candidatus Contendobacter sp.]|nr:type II toxin-antitoxin system RelE/ParE family toxin [Candidatus Contendobacter sp.]